MHSQAIGAHGRTASRRTRTRRYGQLRPVDERRPVEVGAAEETPPPPTEIQAYARAEQVLADLNAAGKSINDKTGRRRSPVTLPEYRQGRPAPNKGMKLPATVLTVEELQQLLDAFPRTGPTGARLRAQVIVSVRTGLRVGELVALIPEDVNFDYGAITVRRGKGAKRRVIGVDPLTLEVLREWMRARAAIGVPAGAPLFCTFSNDPGGPGRPCTTASFRGQLKRYALKAGIEKRVHPHGLRHTFAFEFNMAGGSLIVAQKQLGHSDIETTAHYSDHLGDKALLDVMRQNPWPEGLSPGVTPPASTVAAASQGERVPLPPGSFVAAAGVLPREPTSQPVTKLSARRCAAGAEGEAKGKILELVAANGGRATQAQICRALKVKNATAKFHCEQLAAAGQLTRRAVARPYGGGTPFIVWLLPPLKAVYKLDPRVEFGTHARRGHGAQRVLEAIKATGGRASQSQIAGLLGLTTNAVMRQCRTLETRGELVRGGLDKSTSNRGSQVWALPPREGCSPAAQAGAFRLALGGSSASTTVRR